MAVERLAAAALAAILTASLPRRAGRPV